MHPPSKKTLRAFYRQQRKALSESEGQTKAKALLNTLATRPEFLQSSNIAFYWPHEGEIDPRPLIEFAWSLGKNCYLPVLSSITPYTLNFALYTQKTVLVPNLYGINEPQQSSQTIAASDLDLVLLPLLAFDRTGTRLGFGGGTYDRTFAFINQNLEFRHPVLIGLGFEFQCAAHLPHEEWDVPLTGVGTEAEFILIHAQK